MDYIYSAWEQIRDVGLWYRRYSYYYFGFRQHELRLPCGSTYDSQRLLAVKRNNLEEVEKKIFNGEWKVDDIVSLNNMTTMLHEAVVMDRRDIVAFLIRQGANPNIRDRNGMTPLIKAAALGREFIVVELLKAGVNPEQRDPYGYTAYEKATLHEEWKTAEILKNAKSYVKTQTTWLWPPDI